MHPDDSASHGIWAAIPWTGLGRARSSDIVHVPARTQDPGGESRRAQIGDEMSRECTPTREESRALAQHHALIPVYREVLADMLTPVRAYSLLCPHDAPGFLLESVEGGERLARYSFIGYQPRQLELGDGDPLPALRSVAAEATVPGIPRFHGGAVGYLGYEAARHFERLPVAPGAPPPMPESAFLRAEDLAIFDHVTRRLRLLTIHRPDRENYDDAVARIDEMERRLASDAAPASVTGPDGRRRPRAHPLRRRLPGRRFTTLSQAPGGEPVRRLPLPAGDQPFAVHVLSRARGRPPRRGHVAREARAGRRAARGDE